MTPKLFTVGHMSIMSWAWEHTQTHTQVSKQINVCNFNHINHLNAGFQRWIICRIEDRQHPYMVVS